MSWKKLFSLSLIMGLGYMTAILPETVQAAVTAQVKHDGSKELVVLSNDRMQLTFEPARGGRCVSFSFLDNNEQLAGNDAGMFLDHWAKYVWPSGLMHLPYQYKVLKQDKKIGLEEWVTVPVMGGGKGAVTKDASMKIATSPDLIGLVVKKTIWLSEDNDCIVVEHEIKNPTNESRGVALYVQHGIQLNNDKYNDIWYLPSSQGTIYRIQPTGEGEKSYGTDWVLDSTAGWMGVRDQKTHGGLIFAFDYNYLQKIYTCGSTAEWFLETVPVGSGKSFKTTQVIKPVNGFEDFVYASRNIVADIRGKDCGKEVEVSLDIAAVSRPLSGVTLDVSVTGWKSKDKIYAQAYIINQLGEDKVRKTFRLSSHGIADGVEIRVVAKGADFEERYQHYYAGDKYEYERRYGFFTIRGGGALAGAKGDTYFVKQPKKNKHFEKPDFSKVACPAKNKFKCLVVFGLYTDILNIDNALAGWKSKGGSSVEFTWANCPPNAIETFPGSYDELFSYNVVVLSDVNFKAIGDTGFEMLCDYVEHGGKLVVTGGPYALGNGEYEGTRFLELLPVTLSGPFDLKWAGKGKSWNLKPAKQEEPLLKGLSFDQNPKVFWHHFVTPKKDAVVLLTANEKPVLIFGKYGKGQVAVLTLSPTGIGIAGETAWWDWKGWEQLMKNIFTWMNE